MRAVVGAARRRKLGGHLDHDGAYDAAGISSRELKNKHNALYYMGHVIDYMYKV